MKSYTRILLITDEEWNDFVYGNGVLTNWFSELSILPPIVVPTYCVQCQNSNHNQ